MRRHFGVVLGALGLSILTLVQCSGPSRLDSADAGRTVSYIPGLPNFDMEAIATLRNSEPGIDIYLGIPYASLIFLNAGDHFAARYEVQVHILDEEGKNILGQYAWRDTVQATDYAQTQDFEAISVQRRMAFDAGTYVVSVTLIDENSQKQAIRLQRVSLVDLLAEKPGLSRIRLEARKQENPFEPVVALHSAARLDSLRAVIELYGAERAQSADVRMTLLQFRTDTLPARLPYFLTPSRSSLAYRGVDYRDADTLQVSRRTLRNLSDAVFLEFSLPQLAQGNYRIDIEAVTQSTQDTLLQQRRDLSLKDPSFPYLTTLPDLVSALTYVAQGQEMRDLRAAMRTEDLRLRFDAFWGSLIPNRQQAANIIKKYYSRVEEANMLFSTHKEGWKTDRGMVYIIKGPPMYIDRRVDIETWHYSFGDDDLLNQFTFERVRNFDSSIIYENYILRRQPFYERTWMRDIERWRNGSIL